MRIQYKHPKIYDFLISFLYSQELLKRFSEEVGKNQTIFDIAAGYGRLSRFIDPSNAYYGIDLNKKFVEHGQKQGVTLRIGSIFNPLVYKESDVFIAVDIVHHLSSEKLKTLFDLIFTYAKHKVIIIEPAFLNLSVRYGVLGRLADWFFKKIDDDGFNKITQWFSNDEYINLFKSHFGSEKGHQFSLSYNCLGHHYLVVFVRS